MINYVTDFFLDIKKHQTHFGRFILFICCFLYLARSRFRDLTVNINIVKVWIWQNTAKKSLSQGGFWDDSSKQYCAKSKWKCCFSHLRYMTSREQMLKQGLEKKKVIARKETVAKGTRPSFDCIPSLNANTDQAQLINFSKIAFLLFTVIQF